MNLDKLDAQIGRIKIVTGNPLTPVQYYGSDALIENDEWRGGEVVYNSTDKRIYIQAATSGTTPEWKRASNKETFATTTTSTSTSTSTSSSTTSSSTSSSSTTTMA